MSEDKIQHHLYTTIPLTEPGDIRLLRILPSQSEIINCSLSVVKLESSPRYRALSYTWGPASHFEFARGVTIRRTHTIVCNKHEVSVTENLYSFLKRLVKVASSVKDYLPLWIDFLCVNQDNDVERSKQVRLMASIYSRAEDVLVWLGEEDEYTEKSFNLMKAVGRCAEESLKLINPRNVGTEEISAVLGAPGDMESWVAVKKLFERLYFTRVWIIQEIIQARRILALCGGHSIDWGNVSKTSELLTTTTWTRWICPTGVISQSQGHQSNHSVPNILRAHKDTRMAGHQDMLLYSLVRFRRFTSTDPRDKVYALLGIAGDEVTRKSAYDPIYGNRLPEETFIKVSIQMLKDCDHLLLLSCAEGNNFRTIPALPSWVPDWSCQSVTGLGVTGYKRYAAAGELPRYLEIKEKSLSLILSGFQLDSIVGSGESKHEVLSGRPFPNWVSLFGKLPEVYFNGHSRSEVMWRSLLTNTAGARRACPAPAEYGFHFASWILSKLSARNIEDYGLTEPFLFTQSLDDLRHKDKPIASTHIGHSDSLITESKGEEYETSFSHSPHLRPFLTCAGYYGVGSESLIVGDTVWIIAGSRVPLILRQSGANSYQIVGGAYVHGLMNGEALQLDRLFELITIV